NADRAVPSAQGAPGRVYVVDTSVLLADPRALTRFAEHQVVLPVAVVSELEGKRDAPGRGWAARQALRSLEELRVTHESLTEPIEVNDAGGTVRVELNRADLSALPASINAAGNDQRILSVAR